MSTLLSTRDRNTLFMCLVVGRYAADYRGEYRLQYGDNIASEQPVQMVLVVVLVLVQY